MAYFPMYVELEKKPCLIVGGGKVAWRKVKVLLDFGAQITVVAPEFIEEIQAIDNIKKTVRRFEPADLEGMTLVVAATDDARENHRIAESCKEQKIPVNAVDQMEDCGFIFPSYVKQKEVTVAITSGGRSPVITQYLKKGVAKMMPETMGDMAEALGAIRDQVKAALPTERQRKEVYAALLAQMLESGNIFDQEDVQREINRQQ